MNIPQNKFYLVIGGVALVVAIFLILFLVLGRGFGIAQKKNITLQFWGVFDEQNFYSGAVQAYQQKNKNIAIVYKQLSPDEYEKKLIDSFASGTGPDIWLMHNTWLPKHFEKILPLPQDNQPDTKKPILTFKDFQDQFVDVTVSDLTSNGTIYALPIYVDTLALYWNKDMFNSSGISAPPATWTDFGSDVLKLTTFGNTGNLSTSGAAIGTAKNINRSTDILALLMMQSGAQMTSPDNSSATFSRDVNNQAVAESALRYYTDFANPSKELYTWNDSQHYSIDAFQEGRVAMMFNYSHNIDVLRAKAPRLNFAIAPMPQFANSNKVVNYGDYWAATVSKASQNGVEAWKFLAYLASQEGAKSYVTAAQRPSARRDLIDTQKSDPKIGVFATQALSARSWFQIDNSAVETIFANMIDDVNLRQVQIRDAIRSAEDKISLLMSKARR